MPTIRKIPPPVNADLAPSSFVVRPSSEDDAPLAWVGFCAACGQSFISDTPIVDDQPVQCANCRPASDPPRPDPAGVFRRPPGMAERVLVAPHDLLDGRWQPRTSMDEAKLQELADSIREHGVLEDLIALVNATGQLELIAGHRRKTAALRAGVAVVPVKVLELTEQQATEIAIISNDQREDLSEVARGQAYERMISAFGISEAELARRLSRPRAYIQQRRQLATAVPEIAEALAKQEISFTQARGICAGSGGDVEAQRAALAKVKHYGPHTSENDARRYAEEHIWERAEVALKALGWSIAHIYIGSRNAAFVWGGGERPAEWTPAQLAQAVAAQRRPAAGDPPERRKIPAAEDAALRRRGWEVAYPFSSGWLLARLSKPRVLHPNEVAEVVAQARRDLDALTQRFAAQRWSFRWEQGSWWKATSDQGRTAEEHGYAKAEQLIKQIEAGKLDAAPPPAKEHCPRCGAGLRAYDDWTWYAQQKLCKPCHAVALAAEADARAQICAALPSDWLRHVPDELLAALALGHQHTDRVLSGRRQSDEWIADALDQLSRPQREQTLLAALAWGMWEQRSAPEDEAADDEEADARAVGAEGASE